MSYLYWTRHEPAPARYTDWDDDARGAAVPDQGAPPASRRDQGPVDVLEGTVVTPEQLPTFPYSAVGRLLYRRGGGAFTASAFVLDVGGHADVIMTAAHCVRNGGEWAEKFYFSPQQDGEDPGRLGWWTVDLVYESGQPSDLAVCRAITPIDRPTPLPPVREAVGGGLRAAVTAPRNAGLQWKALGYPAGDRWQPGRMYECDGNWTQSLSETIMEMANDLGQGASGGPWVQRTEPGRDHVTGSTSRGDPAHAISFVFSEGVVDDLSRFPPA